ncbi:MAG: putative lipoprotein [uncultured Friedmanniella sp.]|uniref:Putative lipoprotein n=1 Tax=uncultured Friedmanniella sp. TaxID=335381 RepID=A0A6J4K482_9ACTN|nr:fasciclin domain-containing protein [uncultured Friedmanniella sp.]CAA9295409.1 MAG: putative lipoprotein [uncultured Friedmanniella sp.]
MFTSTRVAKLAGIAAALALPLSLAACGGTEEATPAGQSTSSAPSASAPASPSASASASGSASASASESAGMGNEPFGAACSAVPESGKGSFDGMSSDPVATAASNNPLLSTLVTAVKAAGLVDTLNNAEDITVFAPTNDAFKDMDQATLKKALADKKLLTSVLTGHVVAGKLGPADLAGEHQTLNKDAKITVEGSGEEFTVNGEAMVLCGNVQTKNATVYIIDNVLLPAS